MKQLFLFLLMMISITLSSQKLNQIQKGTDRNQITVSNGVNPVNGAPNYTLVYRDALPYILDTLGVRDTIISDFPACCLDSIFLDENHLYYIYEGDTLDVGLIINKDSLYTNGDPGHISIIGSNEVDINVNDADSNPTNELQTLSFSMPNLSIGGGNTVNLTGLINDADSNPYNELQTISIIDSTDRVFQIRLHPENQLIKFRDSVGLTEMDTSLISQIISDSLSTYVFETDTSLINQLISDSLATINQDQIVSLTGAGITNVTGTYPNFTITSTEVDGSTTNEIQTLSQSFTGTTEATYTLSNSGGSVKDTTGFMRLETMFSTAGSRTYRYKSNLGAILGITEDPLLGGNSNIEVLRTGNQLTWGLRKDNASNGQIYKYNGTAWALSSDASGISSLNGLTPSTQTFATGTSGTDFNISSATSTHTFNLPTASASNRGLLTSADWTTFNNKIGGGGTLNYVPLWSSGSALTNSVIFQNGSNVGVGTTTTTYNGLPNRLAVNGSIYLNPDLTGPSGIIVRDYTSRLSFWESNTNATRLDIGYLSTGPIWLRQSGQLIMGDYDVSSSVTLAGSSKVFTISGENSGIIVDASGNKRVGFMKYLGLETSFVHANNIPLRFGMVGATSVTGVGTGYTETMRCHTNGNVGIGETSPSRKLDVNGEARIRDLTTTSPNGLVGKDADGVLSAVTLGTGLTITSGTLNQDYGAFTVAATTGGSGLVGPLDGGPFLTFTAGSGMTITRSGTTGDNQTLTFASTGGATDLGFTGASSPVTLTSSSGNDVTLTAGTNIEFSQASNNLTVNTNVSYGYMRTSSSTISLTTSLQKIAVSSPLNNGVITASDANDSFTVSQTGVYEIIYDIDYSYNQNTLIEFNVYKNGTTLINQCDGRTTQSDLNNSHNISKGAIVQLNASDYIELFTKSGVSCTGTFNNINFSIKRID